MVGTTTSFLGVVDMSAVHMRAALMKIREHYEAILANLHVADGDLRSRHALIFVAGGVMVLLALATWRRARRSNRQKSRCGVVYGGEAMQEPLIVDVPNYCSHQPKLPRYSPLASPARKFVPAVVTNAPVRHVNAIVQPYSPHSKSNGLTGFRRGVSSSLVVEAKKASSSSGKGAKGKKSGGSSRGGGFGKASAGSISSRAPKDTSTPCGCGSGKSYAECCKPIHDGEPAPSAEAVLRARFTAYQYRLPDFLVESTWSFHRDVSILADTEAALGGGQAAAKRARKKEREELLQFIDSVQFEDLQIESPRPQDEGVECIAFSCSMRSRTQRLGEKSDFLESNVVEFNEDSLFRRGAGGGWFYEGGDVNYEGRSLADEFGHESNNDKPTELGTQLSQAEDNTAASTAEEAAAAEKAKKEEAKAKKEAAAAKKAKEAEEAAAAAAAAKKAQEEAVAAAAAKKAKEEEEEAAAAKKKAEEEAAAAAAAAEKKAKEEAAAAAEKEKAEQEAAAAAAAKKAEEEAAAAAAAKKAKEEEEAAAAKKKAEEEAAAAAAAAEKRAREEAAAAAAKVKAEQEAAAAAEKEKAEQEAAAAAAAKKAEEEAAAAAAAKKAKEEEEATAAKKKAEEEAAAAAAAVEKKAEDEVAAAAEKKRQEKAAEEARVRRAAQQAQVKLQEEERARRAAEEQRRIEEQRLREEAGKAARAKRMEEEALAQAERERAWRETSTRTSATKRSSSDAAISRDVGSSTQDGQTADETNVAPSEGSKDPRRIFAEAATAFLGDKSVKERAKSAALVQVPKRVGLSAKQMSLAVLEGLKQRKWFVTGKVDVSLFSDDFSFSDPSVKTEGLQNYAEGVAGFFNQEASDMDVLNVVATSPSQLVVVWRLECTANLPGSPQIKPYWVTTTFDLDEQGLICRQEDVFSIPSWEVLLSTVVPTIGAPPAIPIPEIRKGIQSTVDVLADELYDLVTGRDTEADVDRIRGLVGALTSLRQLGASGGLFGAWKVVFSSGALPWKVLSAGKSSNAAFQVFEPSGVARNVVWLTDGASIEASGTFTRAGDTMPSGDASADLTPLDIAVSINQGAIKLGSFTVPLPIGGVDTFQLVYFDSRLRIVKSSFGYAVQVRVDEATPGAVLLATDNGKVSTG